MKYEHHLALLTACYPTATPALLELAARGMAQDDNEIVVVLADHERARVADEIVDRVVSLLRSTPDGKAA